MNSAKTNKNAHEGGTSHERFPGGARSDESHDRLLFVGKTHSTTGYGVKYASVLALIQGHFHSNPIPQVDVMAATGLTDRGVRKAVQMLRRSGNLICASYDRHHGGYYIAGSLREWKAYQRSMTRHAQSVLATCYRMEKTAERTWTQANLFESDGGKNE